MITNFPIFTDGTENMGGMLSFQFVETRNLNGFPDFKNSQCLAAISGYLNGAANLLTGYAEQDTLQFKETSEAGMHRITISGQLQKISLQLIELFRQMKENSFVVITTDNNGLKRIVGTRTHGARFSFNTDAGNTPASYNGADFQFTVDMPEPAPYYPF